MSTRRTERPNFAETNRTDARNSHVGTATMADNTPGVVFRHGGRFMYLTQNEAATLALNIVTTLETIKREENKK